MSCIRLYRFEGRKFEGHDLEDRETRLAGSRKASARGGKHNWPKKNSATSQFPQLHT